MDDAELELRSYFTPAEYDQLFPKLSGPCRNVNEGIFNGCASEDDEDDRENRRGAYAGVQWVIRPPVHNPMLPFLNDPTNRLLEDLRALDAAIVEKRCQAVIDDVECTKDLIRMVCPRLSSSLFVVTNGHVTISDGGRRWTADAKYFLHLADSFAWCEEKGSEIVDLLSTLEAVYPDRGNDMPSALHILYQFACSAVAEMVFWCESLIADRPRDFLTSNVDQLVCSRVDVLYGLITPLVGRKGGVAHWDAPANLHLIMTMLQYTKGERNKQFGWLGSLQNAVLGFLLNYLDGVYDEGSVDPSMADAFCFYSPPSSLPCELALRPLEGDLFSRRFFETIIRAAKFRFECGVKEFKMITSMWNEEHPEDAEKYVARDPIVLVSQLENLCVKATDLINEELLRQWHNSNINLVLEDFQRLASGIFYQKMEEHMSNGDLSSTAFQKSLTNFHSRWSDGGSPLDISTELNRIVSLVLPEALFTALSACGTFYLRIYRALRQIDDVILDRGAVFFLHGHGLPLFKRVCFTLQQILTSLLCCFDEQVGFICEKQCAALLSVTSWENAKSVANEFEHNLHILASDHLASNKGSFFCEAYGSVLIDRTGVRRLVHEGIDHLCNSADEIRLKVISRAVTVVEIRKWQKIADEIRSLLTQMGSSSQDSVLSSLAARLL